MPLLDTDDYETLMRHATVRLDRDACDWPALRRAILEQGGIGPSRDFERDAWPCDLFRIHGRAPDLVATETMLGTADLPPWSDANARPSDEDMRRYLWRSWESWQRVQERERANVAHRAAKVGPPQAIRARGQRSFAELVRDLRVKHGADVDLSGLRSEYVSAYESGERVTVERDGHTYRGTVGATRGPRPRFVLLLSLDL